MTSNLQWCLWWHHMFQSLQIHVKENNQKILRTSFYFFFKLSNSFIYLRLYLRSIQHESIMTFCLKKLWQFIKIFELHQGFMYNFLCKTACSNIPYIYKMYKIFNYVLNCFKYFLIYFGTKYIIFWDKCPKKIRQEKNVELYQVFMYKMTSIHKDFWTISRLGMTKYFNTLKLYTHKKHCPVKIDFIFSHLLTSKNSTIL